MKVSQSFVVASLSVAAQTQVSRAAPLPSDTQEVEVLASPTRNQAAVSAKSRPARLVPKGFGRRESPIANRAVSLNVDSTGRVNQRAGSRSDALHQNAIRIASGGGSLIKAHLAANRPLDNSDEIHSANSIAALHLESLPIQPSYSLDGQTLPNEPSNKITTEGGSGLHIGLNVRSNHHESVHIESKEEVLHPRSTIRIASGGPLIGIHLGSQRTHDDSVTRGNSANSIAALHVKTAGGASQIKPSHSLDVQSLPQEHSSKVSSTGLLSGLHIGLNVRSNHDEQNQIKNREEQERLMADMPMDLFNPLFEVHLSGQNEHQETDAQTSTLAQIGLQIRSDPKEVPTTTPTPDQQDPNALVQAALEVELLGDQHDVTTNNNSVTAKENSPSLPRLEKQSTIFDSHQERFKSFDRGTSSKFLSVTSNLKSLSKVKRWLRNPIPKSYQK